MTDKPVLFSGPMVRALIAGTKTQTRRANHLERIRRFGPITRFGRSDTPGYDWHFRDKGMRWHDLRHAELLKFLPWQIGDRLWVRESWQAGNSMDGPQLSYAATPDYFAIDAWDGPDEGVGPSFNYDRCPGTNFAHWLSDVLADDGPWRRSIHMPRWASRITLIVTDVRVERLQDISEDDASDEGIAAIMMRRGPTALDVTLDLPGNPSWLDPRPSEVYSSLWEAINGPASWDANPWVAAYTFTVHRGNIDTMPEAGAA